MPVPSPNRRFKIFTSSGLFDLCPAQGAGPSNLPPVPRVANSTDLQPLVLAVFTKIDIYRIRCSANAREENDLDLYPEPVLFE